MSEFVVEKSQLLKGLIESELKPHVKKVDCEAFYAEGFLKKLGEAGLFSSTNKSQKEYILDEMYLVEETAKTCMTTAFCLWCHLAGLTYVRNTSNLALKNKFLPLLESGELLAATGLSNPMKYYAGLESLHLRAKRVEGGYVVSGVLPAVSNLGAGHWFGIIANVSDSQRFTGFVSCDADGLRMKEKSEFLGANGSATYSCQFDNVFIPDESVLAEDADVFVETIRPAFVLYQIPLGLGVTEESIASVEKVVPRQNGCNVFLGKQASDLDSSVGEIREKVERLFAGEQFEWKEIAKVRLATAYLTLEAVQTSMLHTGSSGYLRDCGPSRRLREAYFYANLTPTVKHLEKVLCS